MKQKILQFFESFLHKFLLIIFYFPVLVMIVLLAQVIVAFPVVGAGVFFLWYISYKYFLKHEKKRNDIINEIIAPKRSIDVLSPEEPPKNTDKEIMQALLAGEEVLDGWVYLRLGDDGFLESSAGYEENPRWTKRLDILASHLYSFDMKEGKVDCVRITRTERLTLKD